MRVDFSCFLDRHGVWQCIDRLARQYLRNGGVYRLHAFAEGAPAEWRLGSLVPIARAGGVDRLGQLYIGRAEVFTTCFITLWKSLNPVRPEAEGRGAGLAWRQSAVLQRHYPRLCFTMRFEDDPVAAEAEELAAYLADFGEPPPLNASLLAATLPGAAPIAAIA